MKMAFESSSLPKCWVLLALSIALLVGRSYANSVMFSEGGSLAAVDLALKASQSGGMIVAAKGTGCAALVSLSTARVSTDEASMHHPASRATARARLEKKMQVERIKVLDASALFASVGVVADTIYLADTLFDQVTNHKYVYGNSVPISRLAKYLSILTHSRTLERTVRPFGVHSCLIGRMNAQDVGERNVGEDSDLWIYEVDTLGNIFGCHWCCIGSTLENARRVEKALRGAGGEIKGSKEGKEIVRHCLQCIKSTLLRDLEPHEVSASVIEAGGRPHLLSIGEINELLHD